MLYDSAESEEIWTEISELKELVLRMNEEDSWAGEKPEMTSTAQPVMK